MSGDEVLPVGTCASTAAERLAVVTFVQAKIEAVKRKRHQLGDDVATHLVRCLEEIVEGIRAGFHVELPEPVREVDA